METQTTFSVFVNEAKPWYIHARHSYTTGSVLVHTYEHIVVQITNSTGVISFKTELKDIIGTTENNTYNFVS